MKRVWSAVVITLCFSMLLASGLKEPAAEAKEILKLAVVNLDEGIVTGGVLQNYGSSLLNLLGKDISVTGLEDARRGTEEGSYLGYLIIPNTFSSHVNSLNTKPEKSNLTYAIAPTLHGEEREEAIAEVYEIYQSFSRNLSQVYTSSILKEVHQIQDSSSALMARDQRDLDTLDGIRGYDLRDTIVIPVMERVDKNIPPLNLETYYAKSQSDVDQIDASYEKFLREGNMGVDEIRKLSEVTTGTLNDVEARLSNLQGEVGTLPDSFADTSEEEKVKLESLSQEAKTDISSYNANVLAKNTEIKKEQDKADVQIQNYKTLIEELETDFQVTDEEGTRLEAYSKGQMEEHQENWIEETDKITEYVDAVTAYKDAVEDYEKSVKAYQASIEAYQVNMGIYQAELDTYQADLEAAIVNRLMDNYEVFADEPEETREDAIEYYVLGTDAIGWPVMPSIPEIPKPTDEYGSEIEAPTEVHEVPPEPITPPDVPASIEINITKPTMESLPSWPGAQVRVKEDELSGKIDGVVNYGVEIGNNGRSTLAALTPQIQNVKTKENELAEGFDNQKESYNVLTGNLEKFDLLSYIDSSEINGHMSSLNGNQGDMEKAIGEQNKEYETYVSAVLTSTGDQVTKLQENIREGQEKSEEKLEDGLAGAKASRKESNRANSIVLSDFTTRFPYSRIGEIENKEVYDFIAEPVVLINQSESQDVPKEVEKKSMGAATGTSTGNQVQEGQSNTLLILLAVAVALILMGGGIYKISKKPKENEEF